MADSFLGTVGNWMVSRFSKAALTQSVPRYIGSDVSIYDSQAVNWDAYTEEELIRLLSIIGWVYADIQLINRNVWAAKFRMKRKGESRKMIDDLDHPFLDIYHNPNPWMTKSYLLGYLMSHLQTSRKGAFAFLAPNTDNSDELVEIWPINSHQIEPIKDKNNYVTKFAYFPRENDAKPIIIDGRYILWIRYADPSDYWRSLPPFLAAIAPAQIQLGLQKSQDKLFNENRGLPLTLVSLDPDLSPADFEVAKAQIKRDWQDEGSTIAVTRAGQIDTKSLGFTQNELQTILAQQMNRDEIDTIFFGFPIHSNGLTSGEGLKEMDKILKEQVYYPLFIMLQDHIQNQVIKRFYPNDEVYAMYEDPRTYDRALNIQESMIYSRWRTVNEMRENDGDAPLVDPEGMEGLGDLPMPLATNSSFVAQFFGIADVSGRDQAKPPEVGNLSDFQDPESITNQMSRNDEPAIGNEVNVKAVQEGVRAELKRYRTVARRNLERQGDALARPFETNIIPRDIFDEITTGLKAIATEEELNELFEQWQ
jgi:hypothetical protein